MDRNAMYQRGLRMDRAVATERDGYSNPSIFIGIRREEVEELLSARRNLKHWISDIDWIAEGR
jgi:hypothetical protein